MASMLRTALVRTPVRPISLSLSLSCSRSSLRHRFPSTFTHPSSSSSSCTTHSTTFIPSHTLITSSLRPYTTLRSSQPIPLIQSKYIPSTSTSTSLTLTLHRTATRSPFSSSRARGKQHVPPPTENNPFSNFNSNSGGINWITGVRYAVIILGVYGAFLLYTANNPTRPSVATINIMGTTIPFSTFILMAINALVFLAWRVPSIQPMMYQYFTCNVASVFNHRQWYTLWTSAFSHSSLGHFGFNMIAMYSIAPLINIALGDRQFIPLYFVSAGLTSLIGLGITYILANPALKFAAMMTPNLGASGVVCTMFAMMAQLRPDSKFVLIFLPFWPIDAATMFQALVGFDLLGLIYQRFKGSGLGHATHLAGSALGYIYYHAYAKRYNENIRRIEYQNHLKR